MTAQGNALGAGYPQILSQLTGQTGMSVLLPQCFAFAPRGEKCGLEVRHWDANP